MKGHSVFMRTLGKVELRADRMTTDIRKPLH